MHIDCRTHDAFEIGFARSAAVDDVANDRIDDIGFRGAADIEEIGGDLDRKRAATG